MKSSFRWILILLVIVTAQVALAAAELPVKTVAEVDRIAEQTLVETKTPSASVAIVIGGKLVFEKAYGLKRLDPPTPSTVKTRYLIGSVSKQFTAAAILLLQEEGKLSLDEQVDEYFPDLTRADDISIRQLLSHTAGYQDNWPEDYLIPAMRKPGSAQHIMDIWGKRPLGFEPATYWQYSNTNFVISAMIVEKVSGKPFFDFLTTRIFTPLGMSSVLDINAVDLPAEDAVGYTSYALGPQHVSPQAAHGWYQGCGQLAMTLHDLAAWDIAMIHRSLLKPASWAELEKEIFLKNGNSTHYALGVGVGGSGAERYVEHGGEMPGFLTENIVFPQQQLAIMVSCNSDTTRAQLVIAQGLRTLFESHPTTTSTSQPTDVLQIRQILRDLTAAKIDRSLFTDDCNDYFSSEVLHDFSASLAPLGTPNSVIQRSMESRGGLSVRRYSVEFDRQSVTISALVRADGKYQQFMVLRTAN